VAGPDVARQSVIGLIVALARRAMLPTAVVGVHAASLDVSNCWLDYSRPFHKVVTGRAQLNRLSTWLITAV